MQVLTRLFSLFCLHFIAIVIAILFIIPIWWGLVTSFKPHGQEFTYLTPLQLKSVLFLPFSLDAYIDLLTKSIFIPAFMNTLFVSSVTVFGGIILNGLAGFVFATMDFFGKRILIALIVLSFLISGDILIIPTYDIINSLNLIDTKTALILPAIINGIIIFMFMQFFKDIPKDFADAAYVEGASPLYVYIKIYIPLMIPATIGAGLLLFLSQWEAFLWPLLVSRSDDNAMLQVAIASLNQEHGMQWAKILAASSISAIIPLAILLPLQKYYINSVIGSGIK